MDLIFKIPDFTFMILLLITVFFSELYTTCTVSSCLKLAKVIPMHKAN